MKLRPSVQRFAEEMERKLRRNDLKGGWRNEQPWWLLCRLEEEVAELQRVLTRNNRSLRSVVGECADVANMAMMIADNAIEDKIEEIEQ